MSGENGGRIRRSGRAAVVVLGDIGRSPRMQYHALSLARQKEGEVQEGIKKHKAWRRPLSNKARSLDYKLQTFVNAIVELIKQISWL